MWLVIRHPEKQSLLCYGAFTAPLLTTKVYRKLDEQPDRSCVKIYRSCIDERASARQKMFEWLLIYKAGAAGR